MAEELEHDPALAPPVEAIHMPEPSYLPAPLAFALTIALLGIRTTLVITVIGVLIALVVIVRWIRSAREQTAELPLEH